MRCPLLADFVEKLLGPFLPGISDSEMGCGHNDDPESEA
jgi:hypothetical protein